MSGLVHDFRFASRQLRRSPSFAAATVLILALGIGLNSAVFSIVNAVLFRPLPVAEPEDLVSIYSSAAGDFMAASALTTDEYSDVAESARGLTAILAYTYTPIVVEHKTQSRLALGVRATPNFFSTLGVRPFLGRLFMPADGTDIERVVLSHRAWQRWFGDDPGAVGSTIRLNGRPHTVIGVVPKEFFGLTRGVSPEVWVPLPLRSERMERPSGGAGWLWVMGRRARGVNLEMVKAELRTLAERRATAQASTEAARIWTALPANSVRILPGVDAVLEHSAAIVLGGVGLVLLIACTNVANLFLARALARRREMATRRALGASAQVIARQLLIESLLLALLGGVLALVLASASNAAVAALPVPLPLDFELGLAVDARVVLFTLAVATLTTVVFGLAPALAAARSDLVAMLREGGPIAGSGSQRRLSGLLVVVQVALSFVLLVATGLALRGLRSAQRVDLGFAPHGLVLATFAPQLPGGSPGVTADFLRRLIERVRAIPEVESAAMTSHLPLSIEIAFDRVTTTDDTALPEPWPRVDSALVGPGYFETMRIPVMRGRTFQDQDDLDSDPVAIVNETLASRFWPGRDAVAQRLRVRGGDAEFQVVGVVKDGKYRTLGEPSRPFVYRCLAQAGRVRSIDTGEITTGSTTLVARVRGPATAAMAELRRVMDDLDPRTAVARLETLEQALGVTLFLPRMAARLFTAFGLLGLSVAALGIYSLLVYTVSQQRRELGIRIALGATHRDVLGLVAQRGLRLVFVGITAGWVAAAASARTLSALLYDIRPTDATTFFAATCVVGVAALPALFLPAKLAAVTDVASILREG